MSPSALAAAMLALSTAIAWADEHVNCPRVVMSAEGAVHTLANAKVFRGPTSKNVELTPVHGNFDVSAGGGDAFNLVCVYNGTTDTQTLEVPKAAKACDVADAGSGTVASCH